MTKITAEELEKIARDEVPSVGRHGLKFEKIGDECPGRKTLRALRKTLHINGRRPWITQ